MPISFINHHIFSITETPYSGKRSGFCALGLKSQSWTFA